MPDLTQERFAAGQAAAVVPALRRAAPEGCADPGKDRFLTTAGWLEVSAHSALNGYTVSLHGRFLVPHLAAGKAIGLNRLSGKWNHYPDADAAVDLAVHLLSGLWPKPDELAEAQHLGALIDLFESRKSWSWDRVLFGPLAGRKRLPILSPRQPGRYDRGAALGRSYALEDEEAFEAVRAEFPRCPVVDQPDPRPGAYFVTARDGVKSWRLAGPWPWHAAALSQVEAVRSFAERHDPRASFVAFGTARLSTDEGLFDSRLGADPKAWGGPKLPPEPTPRPRRRP